MSRAHAPVVVVFRNDDLAATSDLEHEMRVAAVFERYGVPQTMGVIPVCAKGSFHDPVDRGQVSLEEAPAMAAFLREYSERTRSEIALHGFHHRTNRLSIPSRREYFEFRRIGRKEQEELIRRGTDIIQHTIGIRPSTFIPPWNRLDHNTLQALVRCGYSIVSAGAFMPVPDGLVSLGIDCGLAGFPARLESALAGDCRAFIRVMLHSRTIRRPEEVRLLESALRMVADKPSCVALTVAEAVTRHPDVMTVLNEAGKNIVPQDEVPGTDRARAVVYRRILRSLGVMTDLEESYSRASSEYAAARYEEAAAESPRIDRLSRWHVVDGRAVLAAAGLSVALGLVKTWNRLGLANPSVALVAAGLSAAVVGGAIAWAATAPDTRREIVVMTLSAIMGGAMSLFF